MCNPFKSPSYEKRWVLEKSHENNGTDFYDLSYLLVEKRTARPVRYLGGIVIVDPPESERSETWREYAQSFRLPNEDFDDDPWYKQEYNYGRLLAKDTSLDYHDPLRCVGRGFRCANDLMKHVEALIEFMITQVPEDYDDPDLC